MPGARKKYKESGSGKFGVKITYRGSLEGEILWYAIEERRDQILKKKKRDLTVLSAAKVEREI